MQNRQDRKIILYIKATGHKPEKGDTITEVECLEMINGQLTDNHFHAFINPGPEALEKIKQYELEKMGEKRFSKIESAPTFEKVSDALLDFICPKGQSKPDIIVHNKAYVDRHIRCAMKKSNKEWTKFEESDYCNNLIDVMSMARSLNKLGGVKRSLKFDDLCHHYIDNVQRNCFSAKRDGKLLATLYMALKGDIALETKVEHRASNHTAKLFKPVSVHQAQKSNLQVEEKVRPRPYR